MTDMDGVEHALAWSPRFGWHGSSPPDRSPEAQAALRQLVNELRDSGWTPLRAKGKDFDEERWYARRFRQPAGDMNDAEQPRARPRPDEGGSAAVPDPGEAPKR